MHFTLDRGEPSARRHLVQVDKEFSVSAPWCDNVTVAVILAIPALHCDPLPVWRYPIQGAGYRPLRAGFWEDSAFQQHAFFISGLQELALYVARLMERQAQIP